MPWIMKPGGECVKADNRYPDSYTVLAPAPYQVACVEAGGKNIYGKPNFRLIEARTRFRVGGGLAKLPDGSTQETEVWVPRYSIPPEYSEAFVMEQWLSPEWYASRGWGGPEDFIWFGVHKVRQLEPIWPWGNYEAVLAAVETPLFIKRNIDIEQVKRLIGLVRETASRTPEENARIQRENRQREEDEQFEKSKLVIAEAIAPFGIRPFLTMRGRKSAHSN